MGRSARIAGALMYEDKAEAFFANPRPDMVEFIPPGCERVLELGCGNGAFGAVLKASGAREVVGIELVAGPAAQARTRIDRVIVADVERDTLDLPDGYFDCLICNDVLEHLADPWAVLGRLRRHLRTDGWLVVSIPNVRHHKVVRCLIWPGEWRYEQDGVLDRTHLRFFTYQSARDLVESAGFRIERAQGINRSSLPLWLRLVNALASGAFDDVQYLQFAIVARRT